jgi:hypothetical protein
MKLCKILKVTVRPKPHQSNNFKQEQAKTEVYANDNHCGF